MMTWKPCLYRPISTHFWGARVKRAGCLDGKLDCRLQHLLVVVMAIVIAGKLAQLVQLIVEFVLLLLGEVVEDHLVEDLLAEEVEVGSTAPSAAS